MIDQLGKGSGYQIGKFIRFGSRTFPLIVQQDLIFKGAQEVWHCCVLLITTHFPEVVIFQAGTISLQTSHPVLLLQPDRTLCVDLLHGSSWIHSSTRFGGETHIR